MFLELTNEQRKCFGLHPVEEHWKRIKIKASPYDHFETYVYIDNCIIKKSVMCGNNFFNESELEELLSEDLKYLLPKTAKGKPALLSSSTLRKRKAAGMMFAYHNGYISLSNCNTQRDYYISSYERPEVNSLEDFSDWVSRWCEETTQEDLEDVARFAQQERKHVKFREGDVFRFKLNRRLYGYGRIILDYSKMRKNKEPFWDILMTKPLVCSAYHILTERKDIRIQDLEHLRSTPSTFIADNNLFYGEYEIIGNIPVRETEDYPIMYGRSIHVGETAVVFQCGKLYRRIENGQTLYPNFTNNGIGFLMNTKIPVLQQCIAENSNMPYWNQHRWAPVNHDLRNPKFRKELEEICAQFGISPSQLDL
ncbi:MAG: immunity 26/phosphotriesterase HocA family protein [Oscillospiraceae bacterium]|nr:immunity 26/phosphotriesterase HocA family protein [Oscillospiraceae bacterium]